MNYTHISPQEAEAKPKKNWYKGMIGVALLVVAAILLYGAWQIIDSPEFACESGKWRYNEYDSETNTYCSLMTGQGWEYPLGEFCGDGKPDFLDFDGYRCLEVSG